MRGDKQPPSMTKLVHFLFKQARGSKMPETRVETSASANEGLFVSSGVISSPASFQLRAAFTSSTPFEEGQGQRAGMLLKTLLRGSVVKELSISKLSGFTVKA